MSAQIITNKKVLKKFLTKIIVEILEDRIPTNQNSSVDKPDLVFIDEAAEITGLKKSTIYLKSSKKEIPHMKRGRKLYFKRSELLEWIEKGKV